MIHVVADSLEDTGDVLLIGGDSDRAEMYRMKLQLDGYRVIAIGDATAHPASWRPDLVLIDLGLGDAAQLLELQRLRADPVPDYLLRSS